MTDNCEISVAFIKRDIPDTIKNNSRLQSEPARRIIKRLNRLREVHSDVPHVTREADSDITKNLDNVRQNLANEFESESVQESENAANVTTLRVAVWFRRERVPARR